MFLVYLVIVSVKLLQIYFCFERLDHISLVRSAKWMKLAKQTALLDCEGTISRSFLAFFVSVFFHDNHIVERTSKEKKGRFVDK